MQSPGASPPLEALGSPPALTTPLELASSEWSSLHQQGHSQLYAHAHQLSNLQNQQQLYRTLRTHRQSSSSPPTFEGSSGSSQSFLHHSHHHPLQPPFGANTTSNDYAAAAALAAAEAIDVLSQASIIQGQTSEASHPSPNVSDVVSTENPMSPNARRRMLGRTSSQSDAMPKATPTETTSEVLSLPPPPPPPVKEEEPNNSSRARHRSSTVTSSVSVGSPRYIATKTTATLPVSSPGGRTLKKKSLVPHTCDECHQPRLKEMYSSSQWKNRHVRSTICNECFSRRGLFTCKGGCNRQLPEHEFSASQWRHRGDPARMTMCKQCAQGLATFFCNGPCKRWLTDKDFDASQWKNRFNLSRQTLCKTCLAARKQGRKRQDTASRSNRSNTKKRKQSNVTTGMTSDIVSATRLKHSSPSSSSSSAAIGTTMHHNGISTSSSSETEQSLEELRDSSVNDTGNDPAEDSVGSQLSSKADAISKQNIGNNSSGSKGLSELVKAALTEV